MNNKKLAITAVAVVVAGAGAFVAYRAHESRVAGKVTTAGIVNPERNTVGMTTKPLPATTTERFEVPRTQATGKYIDPKYRNPSKDKSRDDEVR